MGGGRWVRFLGQSIFIVGLLAVAQTGSGAKNAKPEFGSNVLIFDPSMSSQAIQKQIDAVYAVQEHNEFSSQRNALMFLPGRYSVDVPVGFYTEVMGLGALPDATKITGNMHADANHERNNATTTFWRAAEGISIEPAGGHHAVGRLASGLAATHARARRPGSPPASWLGQRRVDVRFAR